VAPVGAASAPVCAGMPDPFHKRFKPKEPVSVLIIQGTKDPALPYEGGKVPDLNKLERCSEMLRVALEQALAAEG
jgi:poly(3-hydroxybutyrate) depolymerase